VIEKLRNCLDEQDDDIDGESGMGLRVWGEKHVSDMSLMESKFYRTTFMKEWGRWGGVANEKETHVVLANRKVAGTVMTNEKEACVVLTNNKEASIVLANKRQCDLS
jgi:hypothetical protein